MSDITLTEKLQRHLFPKFYGNSKEEFKHRQHVDLSSLNIPVSSIYSVRWLWVSKVSGKMLLGCSPCLLL